LIGRRQLTRYDFGAIAEVVDLDSREDMIVVTRDLSLAGCFVKTRMPFPEGTEVRIRITYSGSDFAAIGSVTGNITLEGMEIEFVEIEPKDKAIIEEWLNCTTFDNAHRQKNAEAPRAKVVQLKNRLCRSEHKPLSPAPAPNSEVLSPRTLASGLLNSARNLLHLNDERWH
jgi:PilZ domain